MRHKRMISLLLVLCFILVNAINFWFVGNQIQLKAADSKILVSVTHIYPTGVKTTEDKSFAGGNVSLSNWAKLQNTNVTYALDRITLVSNTTVTDPTPAPTPADLTYLIEYYIGSSIQEGYKIDTVTGGTVEEGTIVTLSPVQLNAGMPGGGYSEGVQVGGPIAIVVNNQVIRVLYKQKSFQNVRIQHFIEINRAGSGEYVLFVQDNMQMEEGNTIYTGDYQKNLSPQYVYAYADKESFIVSDNDSDNAAVLYYNLNSSLPMIDNLSPEDNASFDHNSGSTDALFEEENSFTGDLEPQDVPMGLLSLPVAAFSNETAIDIKNSQYSFESGHSYQVTFYYVNVPSPPTDDSSPDTPTPPTSPSTGAPTAAPASAPPTTSSTTETAAPTASSSAPPTEPPATVESEPSGGAPPNDYAPSPNTLAQNYDNTSVTQNGRVYTLSYSPEDDLYTVLDENNTPLGYLQIPEGLTIDDINIEESLLPLGAMDVKTNPGTGDSRNKVEFYSLLLVPSLFGLLVLLVLIRTKSKTK